MAVDVGSAVGYLDLDISKFLASLKSAQDEAGKSSTTITGKLDSIGSKLESVGKKMSLTLTTPLVGAGTAVVKTTANFESAMSKVSAISGATGNDLDRLTEKAKEMGAATKFSASESAEAFQYMAMAGWKTEDMLDGISGIMNLAAADGLDLATTSDIVTDALTAFGLKAEDSGHFADVLATAASNANTNVSMLGESFKYVAPVAGALGYSIEDTAVALGIMANSGIKAGQAGTSLRSAISGLISPSKDAVGWMESLDLSLTKEDGSMKSLSEVMEMLRDKMSKLSESEQAEAASALFGERAMSGMLAIVNAAPEDFDKLTKSIGSADGKAQEMADTMINNLSGQITILKSQLEGVAIQLGEILLPVMKRVVDRIQKFVDWFSKLSKSTQTTILKIAGIVAVLGPLLITIGKVITAISTIIKVVKSVKTAITALNTVLLANPIMLIVTAIAALVAAFVLLWNKCDAFREFWQGLWEEIKNTVQVYIDAIVNFFTSAWEIIQSIWSVVSEFFSSIFSAIADSARPLFEEIVGTFREAWEVIKATWDLVKPYFEAIVNGIKKAFSTIADWFIKLFQKAWDGIKKIWDAVVPFFKWIWESIKSIFSVVADVLIGFFKTAWEGIKAVWDIAISFFTMVWAGIKAVFSVVKGVLTGNFEDAFEAIKNVWNRAKGFFESVWSGIKNVFSAVTSWFGNVFSSAWEAIKNVFKPVGEFFAGIWNTIKEKFTYIGTVIGDAIGGAFKSAINAVIATVEKGFNVVPNAINAAIDLINKLPGVEIGPMSTVSLPRLAKGGLAYGPTMALVGDNKKASIDPEVISPLSKLKVMIGDSFANAMEMMIKSQDNMRNQVISAIKIIDISPLVALMEEMVTVSKTTRDFTLSSKKTNMADNEGREKPQPIPQGGDTFVFNCNQPIDEAEAARQMKKVKRDIAEGF